MTERAKAFSPHLHAGGGWFGNSCWAQAAFTSIVSFDVYVAKAPSKQRSNHHLKKPFAKLSKQLPNAVHSCSIQRGKTTTKIVGMSATTFTPMSKSLPIPPSLHTPGCPRLIDGQARQYTHPSLHDRFLICMEIKQSSAVKSAWL